MTDTGRTYISSVVATKSSGASSDKRHKYDESVAGVGSEELARDQEVRALRARLKRAEQEFSMLKKALVSACLKRRLGQPVYEHIARQAGQVSVRTLY